MAGIGCGLVVCGPIPSSLCFSVFVLSYSLCVFAFLSAKKKIDSELFKLIVVVTV